MASPSLAPSPSASARRRALLRTLWSPQDRERLAGAWLRRMAAVLTIAAGAIHLAQVGSHFAEAWTFGLFFLVVAGIQVLGGALLFARRPVLWFWLGIAGSAVVIALWVVSRSVGLPFGPEPGHTEELGSADAAASLIEALTIVLLALWLRARSRVRDVAGALTAAVGVVVLAAAWVSTRASGLFDPDPRATLALPQLADTAAIALLGVVGVMLVLLAAAAHAADWWRSLLHGLLAALVVTTGALVFVTWPAQGGQNPGCAYGPLAEVSVISHAEPPAPIALAAGEERWVSALLLSACKDPVVLRGVAALNTRGRGAEIVGYALLAVGNRLPADGSGVLPPGSERLEAGPVLPPGQPRQLVVLLRARGQSSFNLDSLRIRYVAAGREGQFAFASFAATCSPASCAGD